MNAVKQSMAQMSQMFNKTMLEFQQNLDKQTTTSSLASPPSRLASDFTAFRTFVLSSLQCLQTQIDALSNLYEAQEMRSRRKFLMLHGVTEDKDEDVAKTSINTINKILKVNVSLECVNRCHRLGMLKDSKPRPILLKLRDHSIKEKIWMQKANLKGSGITLSEFLTRNRHDLFMSAREHYGVSKCWTRDGHIFAIGSDGIRHSINSVSDIKANDISASDKVLVPSASGPSGIAPKDTKCGLRTRRPMRAK